MKLLRETIRRLILEGLHMEEDLMVIKATSRHLYLLLRANDFNKGQSVDRYLEDNIIGMCHLKKPRLGPCHGALEVKRIATEDGYGPTLYDLVMELTQEPLINDRLSVSSAATNVMDFYKNKRPDVDKQLMDDTTDMETYPITPDEADDCVPGNNAEYTGGRRSNTAEDEIFYDRYEDDPFSYAYNKEKSARAQELLDKGNEFRDQYGVMDNFILRLASQFFGMHY